MRNRLQFIQILRGIATLSVLLFHLDIHSTSWFNHHLFPFKYGFLGVDLFFAISGFIITCRHFNDIRSRGNTLLFLKKRFIRVVPFYWIMLAAVFALKYFSTGYPFEMDTTTAPGWLVIIKNILLLPLPGNQMPIGAAWTLTYEITFYTLFALAIFSGWRTTQLLLIVWIGLIVFHSIYIPAPGFPATVSSPLIMEFLAGCLAGYLFIKEYRLSNKAVRWTTAALGTLFIVYFSFFTFQRDIVFTSLMGAGSAFVILMAAEWDRAEKHSWLRLPFLIVIGNASYSIYLSHSLIISELLRRSAILFHTDALYPWQKNLIIAASGAAGIFAGIFIHFLVEKPLLRYLKRMFIPVTHQLADTRKIE